VYCSRTDDPEILIFDFGRSISISRKFMCVFLCHSVSDTSLSYIFAEDT
jgi:hypothetical protein